MFHYKTNICSNIKHFFRQVMSDSRLQTCPECYTEQFGRCYNELVELLTVTPFEMPAEGFNNSNAV